MQKHYTSGNVRKDNTFRYSRPLRWMTCSSEVIDALSTVDYGPDAKVGEKGRRLRLHSFADCSLFVLED